MLCQVCKTALPFKLDDGAISGPTPVTSARSTGSTTRNRNDQEPSVAASAHILSLFRATCVLSSLAWSHTSNPVRSIRVAYVVERQVLMSNFKAPSPAGPGWRWLFGKHLNQLCRDQRRGALCYIVS